MNRIAPPLFAALALSACSMPQPAPPGPSVRLPYDAVIGAGDPVRAAVTSTSHAFSSPAELAGRPGAAARAVANMEFLAADLPANPRFVTQGPGSSPRELASARTEWRQALGIPVGAPPQPVIDSLYAAARALGSGQDGAAAAALPASIFPNGGQATLTRLAALPPLPRTNTAAVGATELLRQNEATGQYRR